MIDLKKLKEKIFFVLSHNPAGHGIITDKEGWTNIHQLIFQIRQLNPQFIMVNVDHIKKIVEDSKEKEFELKDSRIRIFQKDTTMQKNIKAPEKNQEQIYIVSYVAVNIHDKEEYHLNIIYKAYSKKEAVFNGYKWACNRIRNLYPDSNLFEIKVQKYNICDIKDDGYCETFSGDVLFKWRKDHSYSKTIEQAIADINENKYHIES